MSQTTTTPDQLLYRPEDAARLLDIGRSTLFELLASGEVTSVTIGRSRRIPRAALEDYVSRLTEGPSPEGVAEQSAYIAPPLEDRGPTEPPATGPEKAVGPISPHSSTGSRRIAHSAA